MKVLILSGSLDNRLYPVTLSKARVALDFKGKLLTIHIIERMP